MTPVIAIVGRPNVGKSTLFNCLTRSRQALVADQPGMTRDRNYGMAEYHGMPFVVIDTGGIDSAEDISNDDIISHITKQVNYAIEEASLILFVVDVKAGLTGPDQTIAQQLRRSGKSILLVVNKTDSLSHESAAAEFHQLSLGEPINIAAKQNDGIRGILDRLPLVRPSLDPAQETGLTEDDEALTPEKNSPIKLAIIGRPNVGKSTLVNRFLGEERVIVCDMPGTTRDSIFIPLTRREKHYTLIDTAGVRRKSKVRQAIEKFSIAKTLQVIEASNVVIYVINGSEAITDQDLHLIGCVLEAGRGLVIAINKWDGLDSYQKSNVEKDRDRKLAFVAYAKSYTISALHGTGVGKLFDAVEEVYQSCMAPMKASQLSKILERAVESHQPPLVVGRRIKLRYANPGGRNPPIVVIHGNQTQALPNSYKRYLENFFRKQMGLVGTPIRLVFKNSDNPYK